MWNTVKITVWVTVIIISIIYFSYRKTDRSSQASSGYHYGGQTARIVSTKGLNLRDRPSSSGMVLLTIPHNGIVGIIDKNGDKETISGQTANWYKVNYEGTTGWLWSGLLQTQ